MLCDLQEDEVRIREEASLPRAKRAELVKRARTVIHRLGYRCTHALTYDEILRAFIALSESVELPTAQSALSPALSATADSDYSASPTPRRAPKKRGRHGRTPKKS